MNMYLTIAKAGGVTKHWQIYINRGRMREIGKSLIRIICICMIKQGTFV